MIKKIYCWAKKANAEGGANLLTQLFTLLYLRVFKRIGFSEYYELELYDRQKYPDHRLCIGRRGSIDLDRKLNRDSWRATANNKVITSALLNNAQYPIPETLCTYKTRGARIGNEPAYNSVEEIKQFLGRYQDFPLFIKPVHGSYGKDSFSIESFDADNAELILTEGKRMAVEELLSATTNPDLFGMLIQKKLKPYPDIANVTGDTTSCLRIILVNDGEKTYVHRAFWKVAQVGNTTDNFSYGKTGNLIAGLDEKAGVVTRVVNGLWPENTITQDHPLCGFEVPMWKEAVELCISASKIFQGLSLQNWDVAICTNGPVLLELNTESNHEVTQFATGRPFLDERLFSILKEGA